MMMTMMTMTTPGSFGDGWWRYWMTFMLGWRVVFGFAVASIVSDVLFEILKYLVLALVN